MKKIANLYLTTDTQLSFLEGSRFIFKALDDVEITSDFFPSGAIFFAWDSSQSILESTEWHQLPQIQAGHDYCLKLNYQAIEFTLTYRILCYDDANQVIAEYYSHDNELRFTAPQLHHYRLEVLGHRQERRQPSHINFTGFEWFEENEADNVVSVTWQIEQTKQPQFIAVVLDGRPSNEQQISRWGLPQESVPGIVVHAVDRGQVVGYFAPADLTPLHQQVEQLQQDYQLDAGDCYIVGIGVNAASAVRVAQDWQMTAVIADPLFGNHLPNSLAPKYAPLVLNSPAVLGQQAETAVKVRPVYLVLLMGDSRNPALLKELSMLQTIEIAIFKSTVQQLVIGHYLDYELGIKEAIQQQLVR